MFSPAPRKVYLVGVTAKRAPFKGLVSLLSSKVAVAILMLKEDLLPATEVRANAMAVALVATFSNTRIAGDPEMVRTV